MGQNERQAKVNPQAKSGLVGNPGPLSDQEIAYGQGLSDGLSTGATIPASPEKLTIQEIVGSNGVSRKMQPLAEAAKG